MLPPFITQVRELRSSLYAIRYTVIRNHVGVPDSAIAADWQGRATRAGCTLYQVRRIVQIAIAAHHRDQSLYHAVMTGKF